MVLVLGPLNKKIAFRAQGEQKNKFLKEITCQKDVYTDVCHVNTRHSSEGSSDTGCPQFKKAPEAAGRPTPSPGLTAAALALIHDNEEISKLGGPWRLQFDNTPKVAPGATAVRTPTSSWASRKTAPNPAMDSGDNF